MLHGGLPPGSDGISENEQDAVAVAKRIGYPVMIKAVAGGGGRGMRVAHNDISLLKGYHTARGEAEKAFGNSGVYDPFSTSQFGMLSRPRRARFKRCKKKRAIELFITVFAIQQRIFGMVTMAQLPTICCVYGPVRLP